MCQNRRNCLGAKDKFSLMRPEKRFNVKSLFPAAGGAACVFLAQFCAPSLSPCLVPNLCELTSTKEAALFCSVHGPTAGRQAAGVGATCTPGEGPGLPNTPASVQNRGQQLPQPTGVCVNPAQSDLRADSPSHTLGALQGNGAAADELDTRRASLWSASWR